MHVKWEKKKILHIENNLSLSLARTKPEVSFFLVCFRLIFVEVLYYY